MQRWNEDTRVGRDYVEAATALLQRVRAAHPTKGLYEAADIQWWWARPRSTDDTPQLFWFDAAGDPVAAMVLTAWGDAAAVAPLLMPDIAEEEVAHVVKRGLAHAASLGFTEVDLEVDQGDEHLQAALRQHGFSLDGAAEGAASASISVVESWLAADSLPAISPLADGYRLASCAETPDRPHHMVESFGADVAERLGQGSLYRPDLDLFTLDSADELAGSCMFWFDPVTRTGLVEPMRTEEAHRRRGLARHVLTAGLHRLATAGAERIKIVVEGDNTPAKDLYMDVGFEPVKETVVFSGSVAPAP